MYTSFVDLVKRGVFTLVGEIWYHGNGCYDDDYYHSVVVFDQTTLKQK